MTSLNWKKETAQTEENFLLLTSKHFINQSMMLYLSKPKKKPSNSVNLHAKLSTQKLNALSTKKQHNLPAAKDVTSMAFADLLSDYPEYTEEITRWTQIVDSVNYTVWLEMYCYLKNSANMEELIERIKETKWGTKMILIIHIKPIRRLKI